MKVINNLKVGTKLMAGFLIVILFLMTISVISYFSINKVNNGVSAIYDDMLIPLRQLGNSEANFYMTRGDMYKFILIPEERGVIEKEIQKEISVVDENIKIHKALAASSGVTEEIADINLLEQNWAAYTEALMDVINVAKSGDEQKLNAMLPNSQPIYLTRVALSETFDDQIAKHVAEAKATNEQSQSTFDSTTTLLIILSLAAILMTILISILLTRGIAGPLNAVVRSAKKISTGDLGDDMTDIERKDELGQLNQAFKEMTNMLRNSISELKQAVSRLSSSANEILASTTQVASGAAETSISISETTTTVEEVRQAAQLSSQKAKNVSSNAQIVAKTSQEGQQAVIDTMTGYELTGKQMELIAKTIISLSEQSQTIGGIIASVTDISNQSNLLSVNAAIEAVKAGDEGKGFVVVAQEIKILAEQSKQATLQVRTILSDVQRATSNAAIAVEQGSKAVDSGTKLAEKAGNSIQALAETSNEAVQAAVQIEASSQQQVVGMDQISIAMENINNAGLQNVASMKQLEAAAQDLSNLGKKLNELIDQFHYEG